MRRAIQEAILYRLGSVALSLIVVWAVTGEAVLTLTLTVLLFIVHTLYYMAFRHYWEKSFDGNQS